MAPTGAHEPSSDQRGRRPFQVNSFSAQRNERTCFRFSSQSLPLIPSGDCPWLSESAADRRRPLPAVRPGIGANHASTPFFNPTADCRRCQQLHGGPGARAHRKSRLHRSEGPEKGRPGHLARHRHAKRQASQRRLGFPRQRRVQSVRRAVRRLAAKRSCCIDAAKQRGSTYTETDMVLMTDGWGGQFDVGETPR